MKCFHPYKDKFGGVFPCGQCMPCRINRTREWTIRLLHEYDAFDHKGLFVTLTYDSDSLPSDKSLHKDHLQKFIKRLRKNLNGRFIKYFACGEYGKKGSDITPFGRPHYHLILFGVDLDDSEIIKKSWSFCDWDLLFKFKRGKKAIGFVTSDSCRYVAGYVQKKLFGFDKLFYETNGLQPPFQLQSQGIGLSYVLENSENILQIKGVPYKNTIAPIPKYYKKKLFPKGVCRFADIFEDYIELANSEEYKTYLDNCRNAWKSGLHGEDFKEFVSQEKMTLYNMDIRFKTMLEDKI